MEDLDKMKDAIEELDHLTRSSPNDKAQANVIPVSGGSSDSETET